MKNIRLNSEDQEIPGTSGSGENWSCPSSPQVKKAFRLIVSGATQTGKSAIVNRFLNDVFTDSYLPTIENFHRKMYKIRGDMYQLDILDTSGNDPFPAARRISILTGDIFLIVCSLDNVATIEEAFRLREEIIECKTEKFIDIKKPWIPTVIAANKCDLSQEKLNEGSSVLNDYRIRIDGLLDCSLLVCSAKTGENIEEIFGELFRLAKFPKQMSPKTHRRLTAEKSADNGVYTGKHKEFSPGSLRKSWKKASIGGLKRKETETVSYQDVEARRPSLRTDLLVLKTKASHGHGSITPGLSNSFQKHKKCSIQ